MVAVTECSKHSFLCRKSVHHSQQFHSILNISWFCIRFLLQKILVTSSSLNCLTSKERAEGSVVKVDAPSSECGHSSGDPYKTQKATRATSSLDTGTLRIDNLLSMRGYQHKCAITCLSLLQLDRSQKNPSVPQNSKVKRNISFIASLKDELWANEKSYVSGWRICRVECNTATRRKWGITDAPMGFVKIAKPMSQEIDLHQSSVLG